MKSQERRKEMDEMDTTHEIFFILVLIQFRSII